MGGFITAHTNVEVPAGTPLIFLAGPMTYGGQWQDRALSYILGRCPQAMIATPQRVKDPALQKHILPGTHDGYESQRPWENKYMELARESPHGCLLFWLPGPDTPNPIGGFGKTTSLELGETIATIELTHKYKLALRNSVVFGVTKNFPAIWPIITDLQTKAGNPPHYTTLEATCDAAIQQSTHGLTLA